MLWHTSTWMEDSRPGKFTIGVKFCASNPMCMSKIPKYCIWILRAQKCRENEHEHMKSVSHRTWLFFVMRSSSSQESPVPPIPSYPALCRKDTTSWNHGRPRNLTGLNTYLLPHTSFSDPYMSAIHTDTRIIECCN